MRKQGKLIISCVVVVFLVFAALLAWLQARGPQHQSLLKGLDVPDVEYISIYASYGEREARLSEDDVSEIVLQLNQVNLTGSGTQDYADQFSLRHPMFHIRLKDGMEFDFSAWRPYFIINTENFGERFGYSLGDENIVTGSGYRIRGGVAMVVIDYDADAYNYDVCAYLRMTYDRLCAAYFPR